MENKSSYLRRMKLLKKKIRETNKGRDDLVEVTFPFKKVYGTEEDFTTKVSQDFLDTLERVYGPQVKAKDEPTQPNNET
jgi:hypothetical protein